MRVVKRVKKLPIFRQMSTYTLSNKNEKKKNIQRTDPVLFTLCALCAAGKEIFPTESSFLHFHESYSSVLGVDNENYKPVKNSPAFPAISRAHQAVFWKMF